MSYPPIGDGLLPVSPDKSISEGLSGREEQVLNMIAWGYSNKEIAARLHLSVKTIETYKTRSLEKLGLRGRTDVVRYAIQRGWLVQDGPSDPGLAPRSNATTCGPTI